MWTKNRTNHNVYFISPFKFSLFLLLSLTSANSLQTLIKRQILPIILHHLHWQTSSCCFFFYNFIIYLILLGKYIYYFLFISDIYLYYFPKKHLISVLRNKYIEQLNCVVNQKKKASSIDLGDNMHCEWNELSNV